MLFRCAEPQFKSTSVYGRVYGQAITALPWLLSVNESLGTRAPNLGSGTCLNTEPLSSVPTDTFPASKRWSATDDSKAIERAETLVDGHDVELWNGARLKLTMP